MAGPAGDNAQPGRGPVTSGDARERGPYDAVGVTVIIMA
jgi:hypothetical protein